jgi:hypothetical protein
MATVGKYQSGTQKVGFEAFVGWVTRTQDVEVHPGFMKTEIKLIMKVYGPKGKPFGSETTARRWAKRAMINLALENSEKKQKEKEKGN